jgi:hypothetical protein
MSMHLNGDLLLNSDSVQALGKQHHDLDAKYARYPTDFQRDHKQRDRRRQLDHQSEVVVRVQGGRVD